MGEGAWSEVELQCLGGRISKAVWTELVPLAPTYQLFSWRVRLSLQIKIEANPVTYLSTNENSKGKVIIITVLVG